VAITLASRPKVKRTHLHEQMAHGEVREVGRPAGPKHALRQPGEELLERHEQHRQHQHVQQEPVEAEVTRALQRAHVDLRAAEQHRRDDQPERRHAERARAGSARC
jgi:hypothetical protein